LFYKAWCKVVGIALNQLWQAGHASRNRPENDRFLRSLIGSKLCTPSTPSAWLVSQISLANTSLPIVSGNSGLNVDLGGKESKAGAFIPGGGG
jgi:hypothetical protein